MGKQMMNIQVKPETQELIQAYIATGNYNNADQVINKALKLLWEWELTYRVWLQACKSAEGQLLPCAPLKQKVRLSTTGKGKLL